MKTGWKDLRSRGRRRRVDGRRSTTLRDGRVGLVGRSDRRRGIRRLGHVVLLRFNRINVGVVCFVGRRGRGRRCQIYILVI